MADLADVFTISGSGLQAQTTRLRVISENLANAGTTPSSPNQKPYQRQVVTFKNEFDKASGATKVKVSGVTTDNSSFIKKYDPSHPAADAQGYILTPNVKTIIETMDMREAQRSYEANLGVIEASRLMLLRTIDLLR
ncbi:MAG: flagellar basal body rod protein FlgC [Alphaproteobacteria bacterium]|nr:flagellar basal body rod protein FlgC [Alphaproteobacteria bacterium]